MNRYKVYSEELKRAFGEKVYKIPIHLPCSCPNRDAITNKGGCIFCGDLAAGFEAGPSSQSVTEQATPIMALISKKYKAHKFIVYFQNYTNTYMALDQFEKAIREACRIENVVGLAISTRPDCISKAQLDILKELQVKGYQITIELGLQTVNVETLRKINRGHGLASFIGAVNMIHGYGFSVCAHIILNLPWDQDEDAIEAAELLSVLHVEEVKLHSLYILKDTVLGDLYASGQLPALISKDAYIHRAILFLEHLDHTCVIQRFFARAPEEQSLFCNWGHSWRKLKDALDLEIETRDTYQGRLYQIPHAKGLREGMK